MRIAVLPSLRALPFIASTFNGFPFHDLNGYLEYVFLVAETSVLFGILSSYFRNSYYGGSCHKISISQTFTADVTYMP